MGAETPRSDLADSEPRLRRLLNLEGVLGLDWTSSIVPVVLVDDGTLPGMGRRLRRFLASFPGTGGAGGGYWVKAANDVIIDEIEVICSAASTVDVNFLGPRDVDPVVIATALGRTVDRAGTGFEVSPLLYNGAAVGAGGQVLWSTGGLNIGTAALHKLGISIFLVEGSKLWMGAANNSTFIISGRTAV